MKNKPKVINLALVILQVRGEVEKKNHICQEYTRKKKKKNNIKKKPSWN